MVLTFTLVEATQTATEAVLALADIASFRQYHDRTPYGSYFPATAITLKSGATHRVRGHVAGQIAQASQGTTVLQQPF